jgi:hypothetical protein
MTRHLIKALINALPRFAEEKGDFYAVRRDTLIAGLSKTQANKICSAYHALFIVGNGPV